MGLFPLAGGRVIPAVNAPLTTPGYLYLGTTNGQLTKVPFDGTTLGTPSNTSQPNLISAGAAFVVSNKVYWSMTDTKAPSGSYLEVSMFTGGSVGAPWISSGYNSWFNAAAMTGAFYLNGRMYYTRTGANSLFYRYLEPDGYLVGCTEFTLPTQGITWSDVRGMTLVGGRIVYGSTAGSLRAVPFDETAVDGAASVQLAAAGGGTSYSSRTLFYATN